VPASPAKGGAGKVGGTPKLELQQDRKWVQPAVAPLPLQSLSSFISLGCPSMAAVLCMQYCPESECFFPNFFFFLFSFSFFFLCEGG